MTDLMDDGPRTGGPSADGTPQRGDGRHGDPPASRNRTLRCRTVATTQLRQRHHIRDLELGSGAGHADDASLSGDDEEPHPSEMLLAALGACLTVSIQANAMARGIPLRTLEVHSRGDIDPSMLWRTDGRRPDPIGFRSIAVDVHIAADVPREALKALVDYAVLWSPVANTLHDPVDLDVTVVEG